MQRRQTTILTSNSSMPDSRLTKKSKPNGILKSALKKTKNSQEVPPSEDIVPHHAVKSIEIQEAHSEPKTNKGVKAVAKATKTKKTSSKVDKGKGKANLDERQLPSSFKLIAGSYEKLLYGLEGSYVVDEEDSSKMKMVLKPIFIFPAHIAYIKAVASSPDGGKWLATGSTDENIKIWDLRRRKEHGSLSQHEGSITSLSFPTRSHLISTSEDGTICIFRTRDWILLRSLKGHKGRVNCVAVHPSGKVALSVGKDRTLRMWDLMRGKGSASTKLGKEGELVRWSSKGDRFVVQSGSALDIYSTDMVLLHTLTHPARVHDISFCSRLPGDKEAEYLLVAAEDKKVTFYETTGEDSTSLPVIAETAAHKNRVKAMDTLSIATKSSSDSWTTILSTASSDGFLRIFDLSQLKGGGESGVQILESIAEYDTKGSRLTCCTLADNEVHSIKTIGKRKQDEEEGEEDEFGGFEDDVDSSDSESVDEEK